VEVGPHPGWFRYRRAPVKVSVEARVNGTRAHRPEDLMFTLPRIAASAAAALASLALVPAVVAGLQGSSPVAQTHVRMP
jgi:hypothetical protein